MKSHTISYIDLCNSVAAYHEEVFGTPLHIHGESRTLVLRTQHAIAEYVAAMTATFGGREALRIKGWQIKEADPQLQSMAIALAEDREYTNEQANFIIAKVLN